MTNNPLLHIIKPFYSVLRICDVSVKVSIFTEALVFGVLFSIADAFDFLGKSLVFGTLFSNVVSPVFLSKSLVFGILLFTAVNSVFLVKLGVFDILTMYGN